MVFIEMMQTIYLVDVLNSVCKILEYPHDIVNNSDRSFVMNSLESSMFFHDFSMLSLMVENIHSVLIDNHPKISKDCSYNRMSLPIVYLFTLINVRAMVAILVASSKPEWRLPINGKSNLSNISCIPR